MDLRDELRLYVPQLPRDLTPVPVMKMEVQRPAVLMRDVWGVEYYVHPTDSENWSLEAVTPAEVSVFRPVSRNPGEAVALVETVLGFRGQRSTSDSPYDIQGMTAAAGTFDVARSEAWGDGPVGRARTVFPMLNYGQEVDWETYYILHPEAAEVYEWRSQ